MLFRFLQAREAVEVGAALADELLGQAGKARPGAGTSILRRADLQRFLDRLISTVDRKARPLRLNLFERAKLANTFKWRLLEQGFEPDTVNELTQALLLRLSQPRPPDSGASSAKKPKPQVTQALLSAAEGLLAGGEYERAIERCEELLERDPKHPGGHNALGVALAKLGRYKEAEVQFRLAISAKARYADAHSNLGAVLKLQGFVAASELPLRRALSFKPTHLEARLNLGASLILLGRMQEAKACLTAVLKVAPRHTGALVRIGEVAAHEGRFREAEAAFKRALEVDPKVPGAWAGLVRLRVMTSEDRAWLEGAEQAVAAKLAPLEEADLRFAMGKYYDDIGDFTRAFQSYRRANELQQTAAEPYRRDAREALVDDLIHVYTKEALAGENEGASDSEVPVFVLGMARSGTTLVEQIITSHPAAWGAGELEFWAGAMRAHGTALRARMPESALRRSLSASYLQTLRGYSSTAVRIVDKALVNSDYLGIIHAAFPRARMIYVRRDPVDACLSCYFQQFSPAVNYAMNLEDLAHYNREHRRLIDHWRKTLPAATLLEVPYEQLVADQERWTRRMLEFIGLPWADQCLDFHLTESTVLTASNWQVRQAIYHSSIGRWRNYQKFIGPLLELRG